MKNKLSWLRKNKRLAAAIFLSVFLVCGGIGYGIYYGISRNQTEVVYKETTVMHGGLTVGITEDGEVEVGTIEQSFDLDISAFASSNSSSKSSSKSNHMAPGGSGSNSSSSSRSMEVEEVYVTVGQQISKGDPLFKLVNEDVEDIREDLVSDEEEARVTYEKLLVDQVGDRREAKQTYDLNLTYGEEAQLELEETTYDLQTAVDDAQEALESAQETLDEYQEDLDEIKADYEEAQYYLQKTTDAVEYMEDQDTYWYLENEASREEAEELVDDYDDEIESLEEKIRDQQHTVDSLQIALNEAQEDYQTGVADASYQADVRKYNLEHAAEIYSVATDLLDYNEKIAKEDYDDASQKLKEFDSYIVDDTVYCEYDGVITAVSVEAGGTVKNDSSIVTLNNFEDVTVSVDVDDEDMKNISVGDTVNLYFSAFPDDNFSGVVSDIGDATIDSNSNVTYEVEVAVSGDVSALYQGMTGEVTFITKEVKEVTYVSNRAINLDGTRSFVYAKDEEGNVVEKDIVTGFSDGNNVEVKEGLSEGDVVLIESKVKSE